MIRRVPLLAVVLVVAGCAASGGSTTFRSLPPGPSGSPATSPGAALSTGQIRLSLIDQLGPRWYCDPDEFPVAHGDPQAAANQHFAEVQAEADTYGAVLSKLGLAGQTSFTDAQKLAIYTLWKPAVSIPLNPIGNDRFRFDYLAQPQTGQSMGTHTTGTIDATGKISIDEQAPAGQPNCPICLARGTRIATPSGAVPVDQLRLGDPIWTIDARGDRVAGTVIALGSAPAPDGHVVIRLTLADGRTITASPGHPLADGRHVGEIRLGDAIDGSAVTGVEPLPYTGGETFDIVASGDTGEYFAGGIPMGSTLLP